MSSAYDGLEVVSQFVNTIYLAVEGDELSDPAALVAWLRERGLVEEDVQANDQDLERSREIREAIRALLYANNGGALDPKAPRILDAAASRAGLRLRFDEAGKAAMAPATGGVDGAHGRLLAIIADAMRDGSWALLKACRSEDCRWAFFDESKNHSRTWCSMSSCGNRAKARAFRERHSHA